MSVQREPKEPHQTMRALRVDLIIAVCALLVSSLATAASWWQTRVIAQQLSAAVWPYVSFNRTATPDGIELDLGNDGLGPAVIKSFVLDVDGKPQPDFIAALTALVGHVGRGAPGTPEAKRTILLSVISAGQVLRPSSTQPIFHISHGADFVARLLPQLPRVKLDVCYCSILATCWTLSSDDSAPVAVRFCADRRADQLREVPPDVSRRSGGA